MIDTLILALCVGVFVYAVTEPDLPPPGAVYVCAHDVRLCK